MPQLFTRLISGASLAALLLGSAAIAESTDGNTQPESQGEQIDQQSQTTEGTNQGKSAESGASDDTADAANTSNELSTDTVVATVGETSITLGELIAARRVLPPEFLQLPDEILTEALIEQLTNQALLSEAARAAGLDQKLFVQFALKNQTRSVLAGAYMAHAIDERVTEEAIQAAYEERFANAEPVEEAHAAHILVGEEATAKEIKAELDAGADFAALASEHGTDGTADRGGDLGWFEYERMVPPFAEAAFSMEPGTISEPVQTQFGWHIIRLIEKRHRPVPTLEAVRDQITAELAETAQAEALSELRKGATIETNRAAVPSSAIRADELLDEE